MILHRHQDLERAAPAPGLFRITAMDRNLGSGAPATFLAPANTVHVLRNVGAAPAVLCIAYPSVNVDTYFADGVPVLAGAVPAARGSETGRGAERNRARLPGQGAGPDAREVLPRPS